MDNLDYKIIDILRTNARTSFKHIAQEIGLTSPAVKARIERLEKNGIIKGYSLLLDKVSLGYTVTAFISVAVEPHLKDDFYAYVRECPNIVESHGITGEYFALLKVLFRSTMDMDNFLNTIQRFGETSTNIVLSTQKDITGWLD